MSEVEDIVGWAVPIVNTAVAAYGSAVLSRAENSAADATARLGRRILKGIINRTAKPAPLKAAVSHLNAGSDDPDAVAELRLQIRKVVESEPGIARWLAQELSTASPPSGNSVHITGDNRGIISTGDSTINIIRP